MKRIGNIYNDISSLDNCIEAAKNVIKYKKKRNVIGSLPFDISINPEYYGYMISEMLKNKTFTPSKPDHFIIYEGISKKRREIYAPKLFPDQLIHWAIMQALSPILMHGFYEYSCGSIPGRGPELIRKYLSKKLSVDTTHHKKVRTVYKYCLKLDIHHFFQSIDRNIAINILKTKIKDKDVIDLVQSIIMTPDSGTGLPIGFYTSQWLANLYLNNFDHWLNRLLSTEFDDFIYVRYVDDLVIVGSNKRKLIKIKEQIIEYLYKNLKLKLKYDTNDQIFDISKRPIDFVGFKFEYNKTTVRNKIYRKIIATDRNVNKRKYTFSNLTGLVSYDGFMNKADCYLAKQSLYKFNTGFYKFKIKEIQNKCDYKKILTKQQNINDLKSSVRAINQDEFDDGNISKVTVINNNGYINIKRKIVAVI